MKRIPLNALSAAVYQRLSEHQDIPVYDDVFEDAEAPYITFGLFTCKEAGTKVNDITDVTLNIDIWSEYHGKKEVNQIANDIITLLCATNFDLSADGFHHMGTTIDYFEAFPEDNYGYHGVITMLAKIQNKE